MELQLFDAVKYGCIEIIRDELARPEANVNASNCDGDTLLQTAILHGRTEIVTLLIDAGADVNLENEKAQSPLYFVYNCVKEEKFHFLRLLVEAGADVDAGVGRCGMTLLHRAAEAWDVDLVRLLISLGANVNREDFGDGWTPLHYAADNVLSEDPTIFEILMAAGADVNETCHYDQTPIHLLAQTEPKKRSISLFNIMEVFLKYGADFNSMDREYWTPMNYAIDRRNTAAVEALLHVGKVNVNSEFLPPFRNLPFGTTILQKACFKGDLETVKVLLKSGAEVNALDNLNESAIFYIIDSVCFYHEQMEDTTEIMNLLKYFFKWNPDVNVINDHGRNILTSGGTNYNDLPDFLFQEIIHHLAKLQMIGYTLHPKLLETIDSKPDFNIYFEKCTKELWNSKNTLLYPESWVTFYHLLMDDIKKLALIAGNRNLEKDFVAEKKLIEKFPIYGKIMHKRFSKAVRSRLMWNQAAENLSDLLSISGVDSENAVIKKILGFLNSQSLQNLRMLQLKL